MECSIYILKTTPPELFLLIFFSAMGPICLLSYFFDKAPFFSAIIKFHTLFARYPGKGLHPEKNFTVIVGAIMDWGFAIFLAMDLMSKCNLAGIH